MAKPSKGTDTPEVSIRSAKDGGYQAARAIGKFNAIVQRCIAWVLGLGTDKPDPESVAELKEGIMQAWREAHAPAPVRYRKDGEDTYTPDPEGGIEVSADYALGMTTHEYGKLQPNLKILVGAIRTSASKYVSNRYGRIESEARRILAEGESKRREPSSFVQWLGKEPSVIAKRYASAVKRGEPNLPDAATIAKLVKMMEGIK